MKLKRMLCILLVICMIIPSTGVAFAEDTLEETSELVLENVETTSDEDALAEWEANLGEYTETPANAYTPTEQKNLLTAEDTGHAYEPDFGEEEEEETLSPDQYVAGEVLFSREEGGFSLFGDKDIENELSALGISGIEEVASFENESDGFSLFGGSTETVWYKAEVSGDVLDTVKALKDIDGIEDAEPNFIYTTEVVGEPTEITAQWYISDAEHGNRDNNGLHKGWYKNWKKDYKEGDSTDNIEATTAPGVGVVVAVIDTGVDYTHNDLASSMWVNSGEIPGNGIDDDHNGYIDDVYGINATANAQFDPTRVGDPMDDNGHGTHVAGIIAMADNGEGGVGIAYGAKIMAIKAGQSTGSFDSASIARAINYAKAMGADVINMSFGGTNKSSVVEAALQDAFSTCVLVAAAGNDGLGTYDCGSLFHADFYPAGYNYVLGVMASDESGNLASFSNYDCVPNYGCEYEIVAPGTNVYSTVPGNKYASLNGTSMAAPMVAAAAAVMRGYYGTSKEAKLEYNSRFIMGQLVSATEDTVAGYPSLNLYDSMANMPKPNLKVNEVFALDMVSDGCDGDNVIDAGETISLGISIRNQWGKTGAITITAAAVSDLGVVNDDIRFITDTITIDNGAGAFSSVNNGFVYNDGYLESVSNPIKFVVDSDTPNDSEIKIKLTVTCKNGLSDTDETVYSSTFEFAFRVQKGYSVRGHITRDTTWTSDKYWIVENAILIDEGATLSVEPGTQIQFWSVDYEDAYGGKSVVYIKNDGTLNMVGTEIDPIMIAPGYGFDSYVCEISGNGYESLEYCSIVNPRIGGSARSVVAPLDNCNHCIFSQTFQDTYTRFIEDGKVESDFGKSYNCVQSMGFIANNVYNCIFNSFRGDPFSQIPICGNTIIANCIFNNCSIEIEQNTLIKDCLFLGNASTMDLQGHPGSIIYSMNTEKCSIINNTLDTTPDAWTRFIAPQWQSNISYSLSNNYWGTENDMLINKMIVDDDDYPGVFCNIEEYPILTLNDNLSSIYPFVTEVFMSERGGITKIVSCVPGNTYDVHVTFNRDMDPTIQPTISYGGEAPFTDYLVTGDWVSDREWVGTTKISSLASGNMIFRAYGGAASDDTWLVCGTDENRFQFEIAGSTAQSMVLNANGGNGKVDLSWFQNDYELLSGYNIYRSTNASSGFTKIYSAVKGETTYSDTDVQDGVTYYYYFKIVNTEGNEIEESKSNTASAAPRDRVKPTITHTKVTSATAGRDITISAQTSDNIGVKSVTLYYKKVGDANFDSIALTLLDSNYVGKIPSSVVTAVGVQYYLEVEDTAGNKNWSGSIDVPYTISTDTKAVVSAVYPTPIEYGYTGNITIYGANFTNSSVVKLGENTISTFTKKESGTEITFAAPSLAVGAYSVKVDGTMLSSKLTVQDSSSYIQINEGEVSTGNTLKLPVYVGVKGVMTSVYSVITVPTDKFSNATFELASGVSAALEKSFRNGVLTISASSANDFNPGSNKPVGYIVLTPKAVSSETSGQVVVTNGLINNGEANSLSSAMITIYPNFSITAVVKYFINNKLVSGASIKADDVTVSTNANGVANLTGIKRSDVSIIASKDEYVDGYVEAFDAVLILKYRAYNNIDDDGNPILNENQIKAADVDGDGQVTEADATQILKMAVGLIDEFDAGSWIFVPASQTKTLSSTTTNVSFTAIMVGDVDGSWGKK